MEEVLPTDKYVFLRVAEKGEEFWIATGKQEVKVGGTYFYRNGLLKQNFESKTYNRIFDKIYLVSNIVSADHGANPNAQITTNSPDSKTGSGVIQKPGSIKLAEIIADPGKYENQIVQVSGKCVKINPNIMGRNWIHLKDGSQDDYDFVITSNVPVPEGQVVTMTGVVRLNKDFGAGYTYEIIVENAELVL